MGTAGLLRVIHGWPVNQRTLLVISQFLSLELVLETRMPSVSGLRTLPLESNHRVWLPYYPDRTPLVQHHACLHSKGTSSFPMIFKIFLI